MGCCSGNKLIEIDKDRFNYKKNFIREKDLKNINDIKIVSSNLIYGNRQSFNKTYNIINIIGNGSFGKVYRCLHVSTGQERAIKEIKIPNNEDKNKIDEKIFKEIELLAQLDHPHIMKIYEYFRDEDNYYISMELLEGGDLYDYVTKIKSFKEKDAAVIMIQLLSAVAYLHSKGIVHRDLKPENIAVEVPLEIEKEIKYKTKKELNEIVLDEHNVYSNKTRKKFNQQLSKANSRKNIVVVDKPDLEQIQKRNVPSSSRKILNVDEINIKLIDFGASCYYYKNKVLTVKAGTPYYIAPEVIKKEYNNKCDIWSCGVILYILLVGKPPFDGKNSEEVFNKILSGKTDKNKEWNKLSFEVKNLITQMLNVNFNERPSAKDCMTHPWFKINLEDQYSAKRLLNVKTDDNSRNLKRDSIRSEIEQKSDNDVKVKDVFENLKRFSVKNKFQQATIAFLIRHVADKSLFNDLRKIFEEFDVDNDGILSYEEIKAGFNKYINKTGEVPVDYDEILKKLDQDQNNLIEYEEFLRNFVDMRQLLTKKNLMIAFKMFDIDENGELSLNEIKEALGVIDDDPLDKGNKGMIGKVLENIDSDGNGTISFEEFEKLMLGVIK